MTAKPVRKAAILAAGGLCLLVALPSLAYRLSPSKWPVAHAHLLLDDIDLRAGSGERRVFTKAMDEWNAVQGSRFALTFEETSYRHVSRIHDDRVSGVAFGNNVQPFAFAATFSESVNGVRRASDVLFDRGYNWSTKDKPGWFQYSLLSTARHELGHVVGLDHSNSGCSALMGSNCATPGGTRKIRTDDIKGARALFPGGSRHGSTQLQGQVDLQLLMLYVYTNVITPGDTVQVEAYVNNGGDIDTPRMLPLAWVLSTNSTASMDDRLLYLQPSSQQTIAAGSFVQVDAQLTIPPNLNAGDYWLGVIVDPYNTLVERNDENNSDAYAIVVGNGAPAVIDWRVTDVKVTPTQTKAGKKVTIDYVLRQDGNATATVLPATNVYLSTNSSISTTDQRLIADGEVRGSYPPGFRIKRSQKLKVKANARGYFVGVLVDPAATQSEITRDNNTAMTLLSLTD